MTVKILPDLPSLRSLILVRAVERSFAAARDRGDQRLESYARLLYDQAVIAEGSKIKDPQAFARRVNDLLARSASS